MIDDTKVFQQDLVNALKEHNNLLQDQNQILTLILEQMRYLR